MALQFDHEGTTYRISFKHEQYGRMEEKDGKKRFFPEPRHVGHTQVLGETTCFIGSRPKGADPKDTKTLGYATARCSVADKYERETGRWIALQRAIDKVWPQPGIRWELAIATYKSRPRKNGPRSGHAAQYKILSQPHKKKV